MNLQTKTIAFIGAGNMAEALIRGLLVSKVLPARQIVASDVRQERLDHLTGAVTIRAATDNAAAVRGADIVVLAVKPQQMGGVLAGLRNVIASGQLIISIAAGLTTSRIEKELGGNVRVIRVMPNTPALVGAGTAALAKGRYATADDLRAAETLLQTVGITVTIDEKFLDAVTAVSGSGPAYVFLVTEAMIQAGIEQGLPADIARKLAVHTVFGAAMLLAHGSDEPAELRRKVTSPGGTTEAALQVMTERKLPAVFSEAIAAATRRGRELSGE